jgi:hypothetical protein
MSNIREYFSKNNRKNRELERRVNRANLNEEVILRDYNKARKDPLVSVGNGFFKEARGTVSRANCNFYRGSDGKTVIKSGSCGIGETHFKCMMCGLVNDYDAIPSIHELNFCELCEVAGENAEFWKKNIDNFPLDKYIGVRLLKILIELDWWVEKDV